MRARVRRGVCGGVSALSGSWCVRLSLSLSLCVCVPALPEEQRTACLLLSGPACGWLFNPLCTCCLPTGAESSHGDLYHCLIGLMSY